MTRKGPRVGRSRWWGHVVQVWGRCERGPAGPGWRSAAGLAVWAGRRATGAVGPVAVARWIRSRWPSRRATVAVGRLRWGSCCGGAGRGGWGGVGVTREGPGEGESDRRVDRVVRWGSLRAWLGRAGVGEAPPGWPCGPVAEQRSPWARWNRSRWARSPSDGRGGAPAAVGRGGRDAQGSRRGWVGSEGGPRGAVGVVASRARRGRGGGSAAGWGGGRWVVGVSGWGGGQRRPAKRSFSWVGASMRQMRRTKCSWPKANCWMSSGSWRRNMLSPWLAWAWRALRLCST
ncbi:hypothetical protein DFJ69_0311 [Thermomonospora umbrina]|uniref:Uncharacterized protein n=1 Tax=Thermomonospora umbrina TaxID=111806 RepID=A0A3D9SGB1_9ACTN|nr:hypothetical protein DFJ69_0311 [Thermomonospora umbrina]